MRAQIMAKMGASHSIEQDTRFMGQVLKEQYDVEEVELQEGIEIPADTTVLIIHETENLTVRRQYEIDQFLMKGGKVIFLQSGMKLTQGMMGQDRNVNYLDMLSSYGLSLNKNMVLDLYNYPALIPSGNRRYLSPFPFWIKVSSEQVGKELPGYIRDISGMGFTFASSIDIEKKDGVEYRTVATSSGKSWEQKGMVMANPEVIKPPQESEMKKFTLAAIATGNFPSAFDGKELPEGISSDNFLKKGTAEGSILFIAAPEFILDRTLQMFQSNAVFFVNMVDYMTNSKQLASIRSKNRGVEYIHPGITGGIQAFIRWFGTLFIPIIVVIFGIVRMMLRNKRSGRR